MISCISTTNPLSFSLLHKRPHLSLPSTSHFKLLTSNPTKNPIFLPKPTTHFTNSPHFLSPPHKLRSSTNGVSETLNNDSKFTILEDNNKPIKTILWVLFWTSFSLAVFAFSKDAAKAASSVVVTVGGGGGETSIKASSVGVKVAEFLRRSGWCDEAIVFALATLPVIELRGAIPVGYWMNLNPVLLTSLSVVGNMVPVPFIILYLKKIATFLAGKSSAASRFLDMLFERAKEKAGPVEEFQWLGLMLFVAVPFPGTGAWSGAIIASVLDIPFWSAVSANFFGVVGAGLLVNLLVNLGLKYAILTAFLLFFVSTFMWSVLRSLKKSLNLQN